MGNWRKSTYSDANGGDCVELANDSDMVMVRDTTNRGGGTLTVTADAWRAFLVSRSRVGWPPLESFCVPVRDFGLCAGWQLGSAVVMADPRLEPLVLSQGERRTLENWVKRRSTAQGLALRARIILACADGGGNTAVAARLGVNFKTVSRWRARFLRDRLDGLTDEPRPGVPRTITDAQVEEVIVRTLEEVPEGSTHWSKRELARRTGISPTSVHRIWRSFGLQPWRTEDFKVSPDPLLIDKIRDVVGLYLAPPANAAVFAVDEKPQIQALQRTAPGLPMIPGVPERRSHDYVRHGTVDLFAALNTATGKVISKLSAQHRAIDFRDFLDDIDRQVAPGLDVHVICDNLSAHKAPAVQKWLLAHPRFQLHFTPTYSSWISQVERWFAELQRRCLDRGVFCSLDDLTTALEEWIELWNATARPFKWTKTADQIIDRICRYCSRISGPAH
jgi:transposase